MVSRFAAARKALTALANEFPNGWFDLCGDTLFD
jgi:hypothetical protein